MIDWTVRNERLEAYIQTVRQNALARGDDPDAEEAGLRRADHRMRQRVKRYVKAFGKAQSLRRMA